MSFNVDALQSRCRKRDQNTNNSNENNNRQESRNEPFISVMGEAVKSLTGAISDVIESFWTRNDVTTTPTNNRTPSKDYSERIRDDVMVEVDAIIVYDQTIEDGFVEVALARDVQPTRKKSSRFTDMRSRLPKSSPIDIPKSKIARPERKERHFV